MKAHFSNTSENSMCWQDKCKICCNEKELVRILELTTITNYKQWGNVYVKKQKKVGEDKNEFYTKNSK